MAETREDKELSSEELRHEQQERAEFADFCRHREAETELLAEIPNDSLLGKKHRYYLQLLQQVADHMQFEQSSIGWMAAAHRIVALYGPTILRLCGQQSGAAANAALSHAHFTLCVEEAVWRIGAQRKFRQEAWATTKQMRDD